MKRNRKFAILAMVTMMVLAVMCQSAFAANVFANGEARSGLGAGVTSQDNFYGGSNDATVAKGEITLDVDMMGAYGGGLASGSSTVSTSGNTEVFLNDGSYKQDIFGGGSAVGTGVYTVGGNTSIKMMNPNAEPEAPIYGGGQSFGGTIKAKSNVNGNTSITITQGTIDHTAHVAVAGGGQANYGVSAVMGNTDILLSGDVNITNKADLQYGACVIYGGGVAYTEGTSNVDGNTNITIAGGKLDKVWVYGGGFVYTNTEEAHANVSGDSTITVYGTKGMKAIETLALFDGDGKVGDMAKSSDATVKGTKRLVFDNAGTGTVVADVKHFDEIVLKGTNSITFTKSIGSDVKKVKVEGTLVAGTVVLTLAEGSSKPEIIGTNVVWDGLKLTVGTGGGDTPITPVKPELPDGTPTDVESTEVVVTSSADKADIVATTDFNEADLTVDDETGELAVTDTVVNKAIESLAIAGSDVTLTTKFPITKANIATSGNVATFACDVTGSALGVSNTKDLHVMKVLGDGTGQMFEWVTAPADFGDKKYTLFEQGTSTVYSGDIVSSDTYTLCAFVKDGGSFDLDGEENGTVIDPMAVVKVEGKAPSHSSSSGCSAGFAALALLAVPFIIKRKK